jgi:Gpi18-like mannosyltransferase
MYGVYRKWLSGKIIWTIIFFASAILLFSYNAFSYDLFNYIFDAKIITYYGQSPYEHKALDYPSDPMLGFMHWTHRTYPYGPLWLGITTPLSFLGGGYFLPTFYIFKLLMVGAYLLCSVMIYKIAKKTKLLNPVFALTFFALNPFVMVESLVSAHNDIVMMGLVMTSTYLLISKHKFKGFLFFALSVLVKFATILLVPLFLWYPISKQKNKDFVFFLGSVVLMMVGVYLASSRTTFQPWYFLLVFPFASLISNRYFVFLPVVIFSLLILFQYVPYFYTGNYDPPVPVIMNQMLGWSIGLCIGSTLIFRFFKRIKK